MLVLLVGFQPLSLGIEAVPLAQIVLQCLMQSVAQSVGVGATAAAAAPAPSPAAEAEAPTPAFAAELLAVVRRQAI